MTRPQTPLGLIAGGGALPVLIAEAARAQGRGVTVLRIRPHIEAGLDPFAPTDISIGELGRAMKLFRQAGCQEITFAGYVHRPDFSSLKLDAKGMRALPRLLSQARKGDDALLQAVLSLFTEAGFTPVGSEALCEELVGGEGLQGGPPPSEDVLADLRKADRIAAHIGFEDIGQGAVVARGLVLAVEAQEGTDAMLVRVAALPERLRGTPAQRSGALVKRPKPGQDRRIDLPVIGEETLKRAAAAGLAAVGYEAGGALLLGLETLSAMADREGISLLGLPQAAPPA